MNLEEMSSKELLVLHNRIAAKLANPKTFSTRAKIIDRINLIAKAKGLDPDSLGRYKKHKVATVDSTLSAGAAELPKESLKQRRFGVGELPRQLLLSPDVTRTCWSPQ